ncbi:MAG: hypothetical protein ACRBN8_33725 [Nannocystales bacterium]
MRVFAAALVGLGFAGGCGGSSSETGGDDSTSETLDVALSASAGTLTDSGPDVVPPGCGDNLLVDPGFEGGTPSVEWAEASVLFDTPICDASCTDDVGANPFSGSWWVWFGGVAQADVASVQQDVVIPEGNAMLRFGFSVNAGSGSGNDVFSAELDDETIFLVTDAQVGSFGGWRVVEEDVSSFADGDEHTLSFKASIAGVGVTNFFVDDVELLPCEPDAPGSSSSSSTGDGSTSTASSGT